MFGGVWVWVLHVCMHMMSCGHVCVCVHACVYMCMHVFTCACMHAHMYVCGVGYACGKGLGVGRGSCAFFFFLYHCHTLSCSLTIGREVPVGSSDRIVDTARTQHKHHRLRQVGHRMTCQQHTTTLPHHFTHHCNSNTTMTTLDRPPSS